MAGTGYQNLNELHPGNTTKILYNDLCYSPMFDKLEVTEDDLIEIVSLGKKPVFLEGVAKRLCALGVDCSASDTKLILEEIKRRYRERIGEDCPRTIQEWAKGVRPSADKDRVNNYLLCYALEMNLQETADFFIKHFFALPFNYKDTTDAIFFYCLRKQHPYTTIKKMLEEKERFQVTKVNSEQTLKIAMQICDIDDDDDFMQYLSDHYYDKEQKYQRAKEAVIHLMKVQCDRISKWPEYSRQGRTGQPTDVELHDIIMGFNHKEKSTYGQSDFLPKDFTRSLPTHQDFGNIKKGKYSTYEKLRKTLIILTFYDFYVVPSMLGIEPTEEQVKERLGDFSAEVNQKLLDCGMVPLYAKNLFDAVILYCANSVSPLHAWWDINELHYLDPEE